MLLLIPVRKLICILFLGLAIYHSLGLIPGMADEIPVSQAAMKRSLNAENQSSPFIHLRIQNVAELAGKVDFSFVTENQIRVNGHLYDLVGLSIFDGFIDLRIVLNDAETEKDLADLTRDIQTQKGGVSMNAGPVFIPFMPPAAIVFNIAVQSADDHLTCPFLAENPLVGFKNDPGQPPRI